VLTLTSNGTLALSDLSGSEVVTRLPEFGRYNKVPPSMAIDGRYLVAPNGTVIAINGRRLTTISTHAVATARESPADPDPFADHDGALVLTDAGGGADGTAAAHITVVSLATGRRMSLGIANTAAGDPQQAGAFVSVASGPTPPPDVAGVVSGPPLIPDGRVELRDSGRPTVVLATAATLNRALGQAGRTPVALTPYPSPDGDHVAISVTDATGAGSSEGVVIVDRSGRVGPVLPAAVGPAPGEVVTWSPSGSALAYGTPGLGTSGLAVWAPGRPPIIRPSPTPGDQPVRCLWSPNGTSVICETFLPTGTLGWNTAGARGGPITAIAAPGPLLAWLEAGPP
jgi:hypothetical protein